LEPLGRSPRHRSAGHRRALASRRAPHLLELAVLKRFVATVRQELLDHVIVLNERHLRQLIESVVTYYIVDGTRIGVGKDSPRGRPVEQRPGATTKVVSPARVGGLHHRYAWRQAA
jgi:putative transposase